MPQRQEPRPVCGRRASDRTTLRRATRRRAFGRLRSTIELDHVLLAVTDLDDAAARLRERVGLASVAGGRHAAWGTANRIVPLGGCYLEVVGAVDPGVAAATTFGRWVGASATRSGRLLGWAVRVEGIDEHAARLGLEVERGSRATDDGRVLGWRLAGVAQAAAQPSLPFLIEWDEGTSLPGEQPLAHPAGEVELVSLEVRGDPGRLARWLDGAELPVVVRADAPRVAELVLRAGGRDLVIR